MKDLDTLFYAGAYAEILAQTIEAEATSWQRSKAHYVIGALAFSGRIDDATTLFERDGETLKGWQLTAARFFIGIGLVRVSRYDSGRRIIATNLIQWRHEKRTTAKPDKKLAFYAWQGVAFYRYFQCRYERAVAAAKSAWEASLAASYHYGQSLAGDLRGHALFRTGSVALGLKTLDEAQRWADRSKLGGQALVIQTARFYYRAQAGLLGEKTVPELTQFVRDLASEDNFTQAAAQTALAHQLALRGRMKEAEGYLQEAARVIMKSGHRRHKAMVLHKLALNRTYRARFEEALSYLDRAEAEISVEHDLDYALQITGLRQKITRRLGGDANLLDARIEALTRKVGSGIGRNILWRERGVGAPTLLGDDPLGDVRHLCRQTKETPFADVRAIIRSGYLGFLHEIFPGAANGRLVCFDLVPKRLAIFDEGDVRMGAEPFSGTLKAIALSIYREPATKHQLVERHWGFTYHSIRHDPMLFATINRLRHALGSVSAWLIYRDGVYSWQPGVRVFTYEAPDIGRPEAAPIAQSTLLSTVVDHELNHRQLEILSDLARGSVLDVQDCMQRFHVSRVTAFRDFSALVDLGLILRLGKGRATSYRSVKSPPV